MALLKLAVLISTNSGDEFIVVRQSPPPKLPEYSSYQDSDLWDLPSCPLTPRNDADNCNRRVVGGADLVSSKIDLRCFDVDSALEQALSQVKLENIGQSWSILKYVEEADFGPPPAVNTLFIIGKLEKKEVNLQESCQWLSKEHASKLLCRAEPNAARVGPLAFIGAFPDSAEATKFLVPLTLNYQEYPPGIMLVPMKSRTRLPFRTTNLVVVAPNDTKMESEDSRFIADGDALLVDPGCHSQCHKELAKLVSSLPRKLVVFVTHHHPDHVDGLSVIQKHNPSAILLAHRNTISHIGKGQWSLSCVLITGGEKICIGGQQFEAIFAPGHTDGHLGLLHVSTNSLIVGDHCVGQGSAVLDVNAGGDMKDYFQTTYKFLDLSPHVLIPMHGRVNLWPKKMLCGYLKNRRDREEAVLKAIQNGAHTVFDIVTVVYPNLDIKLYIPASSNVRIHVDHLAYQKKLPKEFSLVKFRATCTLHFGLCLCWAYLKSRNITKIIAITGVAIAVIAYGSKIFLSM